MFYTIELIGGFLLSVTGATINCLSKMYLDIVPDPFLDSTHLIPVTTIGSGYYHGTPFTEKKTKAQRGSVTC